MAQYILAIAGLSGFTAVALGAFGAHGLKDRLAPDLMVVYQTAVQYHFYHALALLAVGIIALSQPHSTLLKSSGWLFLLGTVIFSGSLYVLAISGTKWLGAVTPLGGLAFIGGWACLATASWKMLA